ncbi:DUF4189 domain-containing protein [Lysobacter sp. Root604]|uniref:DUF4189 domain-containing protein n=1 Tax=Lysobacter sp. Root604 TaxID=1736568 RepID=UPI0009E95C06|nr:DUF4189 domain-containing protein [Lysobacter sp. Root604]
MEGLPGLLSGHSQIIGCSIGEMDQAMSTKRQVCLGVALLALSFNAASDGQCPDGFTQAPGPMTGVINCVPLPAANDPGNDAGGPRWQSRWGAISFDYGASNVGVGASVAATSKRRAKSEALAECRAKGGKGCKVNLVYDNQCAVVIAAVGYSRSHAGPTVEITAERGMKMCEEAGFNDCQVYYKACSLPEQIQ